MRICIVGSTGSGKTFLAKKLAEKYDIKHTNLDYVFLFTRKTKAGKRFQRNFGKKK